MTHEEATQVSTAFGIVGTKPHPPIAELLTGIATGLKTLGDKGLSGARNESTRASLAGILSAVKLEIAENAIADKINANNAAQHKLNADKAALNKSLRSETVASEPVVNVTK